MDENEKDTQRQCEHHYEFKAVRISNDTTEHVKTWKCAKCGHECERRSRRIGSNKAPSIIM